MSQQFFLDQINLTTGIATVDGKKLSIEQWLATQLKSGPTIAYKKSDTAIAASTTLTADPDLVLAIAAGEIWQFDALLIFNETAGAVADPGFNLQLAGPVGSTIDVSYSLVSAGAATTSGSFEVGKATPTTAFTATLAGGGISTVRMVGSVRASTVGGQLVLKWAQKTSDASAMTLQTGSFLSARKI